MRYILEVEPADITSVHKIVENVKSHPFVQARLKRNLDMPFSENGREAFWATQIMCLVTTQNKSGAGSAVDRFLSSQPFPLSWQLCKEARKVDELIESIFSTLRIRRWKLSAGYAQQNYRSLEQGGWDILESWQKQLLVQRNKRPHPSHYILEREAAESVQELFRGLGPKQSRNFWQDMGLTRYEIPLDSRIMRWLRNSIGFYVPSSGLADERFYCQVMDALRELGLAADVLPFVLDAAVFASYETA